MTATVHYEYGAMGDYSPTMKSPCGAYSDRHEYTTRDAEVTCTKCLRIMGYDVEETAK